MSFAFRHINYKNPKYGVGRYTLYIRILITALFFVFLFSTIICAPIAHSQFTGKIMMLSYLTVYQFSNAYSYVASCLLFLL